ncbi:(2Fe-2S) ferredoxin domain-containing protein [Marmoricola sp. RAF53]|uniref:(2Fe-2S) ferredoxin domain-containing protein n=1 Tax=Marmoricola sp. RAF53 TaxID=3233059 RepID=UPI003F9CCCC4
MEPAALVLVGMSVREVDARAELRALADRRGASVAFLQQGDPGLHRELTRLADDGAERVELVGVSLGSLAPAASWLRRIAAHWWRERGADAPVVEVATALLKSADPVELDLVRDVRRPLTGDEPGLTSAAWEHVPGHRHQLLVCRGPRCTALGSDATAEAMVLALVRAGQGDDDVLVTHTGCQFPCNQAPVVSIQPDDVWYGAVTPQVGERIVAEHLLDGNPVAAHRLRRRSS